MEQKDLSALTDQELLDKAKKMKPASILRAFLIGLMIGVVIYRPLLILLKASTVFCR